MSRVPPHNIEAEANVLGACLIRPDVIRDVVPILDPEDFYDPSNGAVWAAIADEWTHGRPVDAATIAAVLPPAILDEKGRSFTVTLMSAVPATSNAPRYAQIVADMADLRRAIALGAEGVETAYEGAHDPENALDTIGALWQGLSRKSTSATAIPVERLHDVAAEGATVADEWVIPGYLTRSDRMILVAPEGYGKTMLFRQVAVMSATGLNPFSFQPMPPVRSLIVDLENPRGIIRETLRPILDAAARHGQNVDPDRMLMWHNQAGIDIRSRSGMAALDEALTEAVPDVVCVGPLYKLFRKRQGESDEDAALDTTARLDELRTRHGFALMIEHHAPKPNGGTRDMIPFGSSIWMRWPEFGPALRPPPRAGRDRSVLVWDEWRGPRDVRPWPSRLVRGDVWPWHPDFATGVPAEARTRTPHLAEGFDAAAEEPPPDLGEEPF